MFLVLTEQYLRHNEAGDVLLAVGRIAIQSMAIVKQPAEICALAVSAFRVVKQQLSGRFAPIDDRNEPSCAVVAGDHPLPGGSGRTGAPGPGRGRPYLSRRG